MPRLRRADALRSGLSKYRLLKWKLRTNLPFNSSAADDFNNGVVLTRRPLRPNELFQVRLERVVTKWAGSVEMGVTTHTADELDFPFTMTNVRLVKNCLWLNLHI